MTTELPFERAAMRNEELPSGLTLADIRAFYLLRNLYRLYLSGGIDREQASREKVKIVQAYEKEKATDKINLQISHLWKRIEIPALEYAKNPTRKTADAFHAAVYGLPDDWRNDRNKAATADVPWEQSENESTIGG